MTPTFKTAGFLWRCGSRRLPGADSQHVPRGQPITSKSRWPPRQAVPLGHRRG